MILDVHWLVSLVSTILVSFHLLNGVNAWETVEDAARIARKLVDQSSTSIGVMATVYPSTDPSLADQPFSLQEYYASCHGNGSLTLLFLPISRHSRNIQSSSGHSASISVGSEKPAASQARVSLIGNVTVFRDIENIPGRNTIETCYLKKHPDAKWWLPDDEDAAHVAYWARFDPQSIYFVGGFGDEHYIGYIPLETYQDAAGPVYGAADGGVAGRILVDQSW